MAPGRGPARPQIRDDLLALDKATVKDLLAVQLDDRALFLERWQKLLLAALTDEAVKGHPQRQEMKKVVATTWTGHASVDSAAYRLVRAFRSVLREQVLTALTARCAAADPRFDAGELHQTEAPVWALVTARPLHLLDPKFKSWDEQILAAVDETLGLVTTGSPSGSSLAERTWGERNTTHIRHPLGQAVPYLGSLFDLDMAPRALPGDQDMPRVQGPGFGASERLVVSPGQEENGIFHMPTGQSGNPMSPHYRDGHRAWEEGTPTSFLPGKPVDVLKLIPG